MKTRTTACRLCEGNTKLVMFKTLLGRHLVGYHECQLCGSLQTDAPWWLDEAYAVNDIGTDVGICQRTQQLVLETTALFSLIDYPKDRLYVDFGGGKGLYTRMMRDRGYNFFSYDLYQKPFYSTPFSIDDFKTSQPNIITAFEVFEHFGAPKKDIQVLLEKRPDILVFTTELYSNQGSDWAYLSTEAGQHVFFYSQAALALLESWYDVRLFDLGFLKLFVRNELLTLKINQELTLSDGLTNMTNRGYFMNHAIRLFCEHQSNPYAFVYKDYQLVLRHTLTSFTNDPETVGLAAQGYQQALAQTSRDHPLRHELVVQSLIALKQAGDFTSAITLAETEMPYWQHSPDFFFILGDLMLDWAMQNPDKALNEILPMVEASWKKCLEIGEQPNLRGAVPGRGSHLATHNLAVFYESLGNTTQARLFREKAEQLRIPGAP